MKLLSLLLIVTLSLSSFTTVNLTPVDKEDAVTFTIKNFGLNVKGFFTGLKGSIAWDAANFSAGNFNVSVNTASVNTDVDARDNHLRKEEYFDAEKFPLITFASTDIKGSGTSGTITGNLTIKGVTKTISFPFTVSGSGNNYIFEGNFSIDRRDFGVGGNSMVLGDNVNVKLHVTAAAQ